MRVHELDEQYGVTREVVKAALKAAGLNTHRFSVVDAEELPRFEAALVMAKLPPSDELLEESLEHFDAALKGEDMPAEDRFTMVDSYGSFRESLLLPPDLAQELRDQLKGRQVADAMLNLERKELNVVTWPDFQKLRIPT